MDALPEHIAIIMDGNGRWAKKKGAARIFGHQNAIKAVRESVEGCAELGVSYLTLFAFSTENWNRPQIEVDALMSLLVSTIKDELPTLMKNNVRLKAIGNTSALPKQVKQNLEFGLNETLKNTGLTLILALNYSGRWDIENAFCEIARKIEEKELSTGDIRDGLISGFLSTDGIPDPELVIRTSGEQRISNFYLWQSAYSELHYTEVLWPDFRKLDLGKAINDFQNRERRFGKTSEQVGAR
ncbi:MAG: isoprenyl transferase [Cytophagales bacterium]|nr:isoprenyl transferase [Cytophagales bacterium]